MKCVICGRDQVECLDYGIYTHGEEEAMVCTEHQPIAELQENGSLEHTDSLDLLREALGMTWKEMDKPERE